jgi:diguanylate cyclase (GGDEF)-like protein/PAS domain S-box-containing protein
MTADGVNTASNLRQARWESAGVSVAMLVVVGAAILGLWLPSRNSLAQDYQHYLISLAKVAATLVDPQLHERIRRPEQLNDPDYRKAVEPLRRFRSSVPDIHYVYTLVRDGRDCRFVLDAADPAARSAAGKPEQSGVWENYGPPAAVLARAMGDSRRDGIPIASPEPATDAWGTFMSGFAPVRDASGRQIATIGVDVDATVYVKRLAAARNRALLGLLPAGVLIGILGWIFYRVRLRSLADADAALESAEAAKRAAEGLAEERQRLSAVIEGTNVGTWDWSRDTQTFDINDRVAAMIGSLPQVVRPFTTAGFQALTHPRDQYAVRRTLLKCVRSDDKVFACEFRVQHTDGRWVWVFVRGRVMLADSGGRPERVAGIIMDVSDRKEMEFALIEAAQKDRLTGLPNRAVFMHRLAKTLQDARRNHNNFAVLFLDFDRFKFINDTLGHEAGDELLRQIAGRLQNGMRFGENGKSSPQGNLISRFGGDEFLILLSELRAPGDAVGVAERLLDLMAPSYNVFGSEVHSMASIGIVVSEKGVQSAEEIVRNADVAMYEAKRLGRGCSVVFNEAMHQRLTRHVTVETSLRRAIGGAELYLEYQPIVDLLTGRQCYVEALMRWEHPTLGPISPSEFIPIAEESGLIVAVGEWMLEVACRDMKQWHAADPQNAPAMVSVNISPAEIALGNRFFARIEATLQRFDLAPQRLQLELTEREVMRNPESARELLLRLRRLGVKLAMDDFGTGTSSLSLLRGYPFNTIKIDRSFLQDLSSNHEVLAVIRATIDVIENLQMDSLAEGVEDADQVAMLRSLGCRFAQGYYFSRALPANRLLSADASHKQRVEQW